MQCEQKINLSLQKTVSLLLRLGVCKVRQKSMKIVLEVFHVIEKIVNELKHEKGHIWATFSYILEMWKKSIWRNFFQNNADFLERFFMAFFVHMSELSMTKFMDKKVSNSWSHLAKCSILLHFFELKSVTILIKAYFLQLFSGNLKLDTTSKCNKHCFQNL